MAAWCDPDEFNCDLCARKPKLREQNGCTAPPTLGAWRFPPNAPDSRAVEIGCCPVKFVTSDVYALFRALNLSESTVSISEQHSLPAPYLEALATAKRERADAQAARLKQHAARSHK